MKYVPYSLGGVLAKNFHKLTKIYKWSQTVHNWWSGFLYPWNIKSFEKLPHNHNDRNPEVIRHGRTDQPDQPWQKTLKPASSRQFVP
jgi:hypothetical protein